MTAPGRGQDGGPKVAHLTTVDLSLRYLVLPQLLAVGEIGGEPIGISAPGPHVSELESVGIRHIPLPSSSRGMDPRADLRAVRELWAILRTLRPDVLHTHNPKPGLYGRVLARLAGIPVVINTVHGLYATTDDPWLKRVFVYGLEAIAARFSDLELVQSAEDYALLRRRRITRPSRTRLLGNGVDLTRFDSARFSGEDRAQTRKELGADPDTIVVGMVGRLVAEKGYRELFEMAHRLDDRFLVVCVGPEDPDKSDALSSADIAAARSAGVRFEGLRSDVDRLYGAMDLFVLPSHREGFPRAAMEAAAMGLPVIATDIRGCREVVDDGVTGILFPMGDVDSLTAAVERLGSDPVQRRSLADAAVNRAREQFDERQVVRIVMRAYRDVALSKRLDWPDLPRRPVSIRVATIDDATCLADLHLQGVTTGFLSLLGRRFLMMLYRAIIGWPEATVLVADGGQVIGFVAGVADTRRFYRHFLLRYGLMAALAAPRLLQPSVARRAWETLRYGTTVDAPAELLSMAVDSASRGGGIGRKLGEDFLREMTARSIGAVKVVVGAGNIGAISLYESLGFAPLAMVEVHAGDASLEMMWSSSE